MGVAKIRGAAGLMAAALIGISAVGCGGGGGGGSYSPPATLTTPSPAPSPSSQTLTANLSTTGTTPFTLPAIAAGYSATVTMPAVSAASSATLSLLATLPSGVSAPQAGHIGGRQIIGGTNLQSLAYVTVSVNATVSASNTPAFSITFPGSLTFGSYAYIAYYDEKNASAGWTTLLGPGTVNGNTISFSAATIAPPITLQQGDTYVFALVTSGSLITPTPSPTSSPVSGATAAPTLPPISHYSTTTAWGPYAVANAFQFPVQSGYNGSGVTIAIVGDNPPLAADVSAYLSYFGVTRSGTYTVENVGTGQTTTDTNGQQEATLDVETIEALAPGANVIFYWIPDLSGNSFLNAYSAISSDQKATVASVSFGGCEVPAHLSSVNPVLSYMAGTRGIAIVASAGDQGDECYNGTGYQVGVNFPASDPNVIGVGGTESNDNPAPITNPVAWNDMLCLGSGGTPQQCATGGGISGLFTIPSYQSGISGEASTTYRNVPDIALPAVSDAVYFGGHWIGVNGTSWSAPQAAAMMAGIYEYCQAAIQNPVTVFYNTFAAKGYADFEDVTSGNNQFGSDTTYYTATTGFDNVSGIGIPLGMPIAQNVCAGRNPFLAHRATGTSQLTAQLAPAVSTSINNVPNLRGLTDNGERAGTQTVSVALVLRATANLAQNENAVTSALQQAGFSVVKTYSNHLVVDAQAPAAIVEQYFQTRVHNFAQGSYGQRYANTAPVIVPAQIAPYVQGVITDNLITAKPL